MDGIKALSPHLPSTMLKSIKLSSGKVLFFLKKLILMRNNVLGNDIRVNGINYLCPYLPKTKITSLNISGKFE